MFLATLVLLVAGHQALAQSSLTVTMAWEHDNPWIASSVWDFDDITHYEVGCHTSADPDDCIIYTPFTLTQAPSFARFTTTLPGKTDSSVIQYCDWAARTPGCGWSDNFGDGTWGTFFMTPDGLSNTETVVPLVTSADFLTLDEPSDTDALPTRTAPSLPTPARSSETASVTPFGTPDEEDDDGGNDNGGGGPRGGFLGPFGGFPGVVREDDEGYAERRFMGHVVWVVGVAIAIVAVLV